MGEIRVDAQGRNRLENRQGGRHRVQRAPSMRLMDKRQPQVGGDLVRLLDDLHSVKCFVP